MAKDNRWIEKATKNKGALRRHLGVKAGKNIPGVKLEIKKKDSSKVKKEKVLAGTLARLRKHL